MALRVWASILFAVLVGAVEPAAAPREVDVEIVEARDGALRLDVDLSRLEWELQETPEGCRQARLREPSEALLRVALPLGRSESAQLGIGAVSERVVSPAGICPQAVGPPARVVTRGTFRDVDVVEIAVAPLRAETSGRVLRVDQIELTLSFEPARAGEAVAPVGEAFRGLYDDLFVNDWRPMAFGRTLPVQVGSLGCLPAAVNGGIYRIDIPATGLYRIDRDLLAANTDWNLRSVDPRNVRVFDQSNGCRELAIRVEGEADGTFDAGDYLEIYGPARTDESQPGTWQKGDYTDVRALYLVPSSSPGVRMSDLAVDPAPGPPVLASFVDTVRFEDNPFFAPFVEVAGEDVFMWKYAYYLSGDPSQAVRSHDLTVPDPAGTGTVDVVAELRGATSFPAVDPDHHASLTLNGTMIADETWDGRAAHQMSAAGLPASILTPSSTMVLEVFDPDLLGVASDGVFSNYFEITYDRLTRAVGDELLIRGPSDVERKIQVENLSSSEVTVLDVTDPFAPVRLTGAQVSGGSPYTATYDVTFPVGGAIHAVIGASAYRTPAAWRRAFGDDLWDTGNGADWLLIGPAEMVSGSGVPSLPALIAHRQSAAGGSLRTRVVDVQDIYDQFGAGTLDPEAIRDFLSFAYQQWDPPAPSYAVLVGDASIDYKDNLGAGLNNHTPSHVKNLPGDQVIGYQSEDSWYGLLAGGDLLPEIHVSRVPARTPSEADAFYAKALSYETAGDGGLWRGRLLLVADSKDASAFESESDVVAALVTGPTPPVKIYHAQPPWNGTTIDASPANGINDIVDVVDGGALLTSYIGHGAFHVWSSKVLMDPTIWATCSTPTRLTVVLNADCFTGAFHHPTIQPTLLEAMTVQAGTGMVGGGAPASYSYSFLGSREVGPFVEGVYGETKERLLGSLLARVRAELATPGFEDLARSYTSFGDAATRLAMPSPGAPTSLSVDDSGDQYVTLSWIPSTDPETVASNLYRATDPAGPFVLANPSPVVGATWTDSGLTNNVDYWYWAVGVDVDGFEGPRGPDTVTAKPLNLVPPQKVTGVAVTDLQTGYRAEIGWNANPEGDLCCYIVQYGPASGTYTDSVELPATETSLRVEPWTSPSLFAVVAAKNTSEITGLYSDEASGAVTSTLGYEAPRMPLLRLKKSGGDPMLEWDLPAEDLFGGPAEVTGYRVYRDVAPEFVPDKSSTGTNRVADLYVGSSPPPVSTWVDGTAPAGLVFYHVTATTDAGEESSAGRTPPGLVTGLIVQATFGNSWGLNWDRITWDWDGNPLPSSPLYHVYRGATANFQPDLADHSNRIGTTALEGYIDWGAQTQVWYYKVTASDSKGNECSP